MSIPFGTARRSSLPGLGLLAACLLVISGTDSIAQTTACPAQDEPAFLARALQSDTPETPQRYLACFPFGDGAISVRRHLAELNALAECQEVLGSNDPDTLRNFIMRNSGNDCAPRVAERLSDLRPARTYRTYLNAFPDGDLLRRGTASDAMVCARDCDNADRCVGYAFERNAKTCTLWTSVRGRSSRTQTETGELEDGTSASPLAGPPVAQPAPAPADNCSNAAGHWNQAKEFDRLELYEEHYSLFANCAYASFARLKIAEKKTPPVDEERNLWDRSRTANTARAYRDYLDRYPNGRFAGPARTEMAKLGSTADCAANPQRFSYIPTVNETVPEGGAGEWYVILGSYTDMDGARKRCSEMRTARVPARIIDTNNYRNFTPGYHSVVVGPYSKTMALRVVRLVKEIVGDAFIKNSR